MKYVFDQRQCQWLKEKRTWQALMADGSRVVMADGKGTVMTDEKRADGQRVVVMADGR